MTNKIFLSAKFTRAMTLKLSLWDLLKHIQWDLPEFPIQKVQRIYICSQSPEDADNHTLNALEVPRKLAL